MIDGNVTQVLDKYKLYGDDFDQGLKTILREINQKYGEILFDELMNRIEETIHQFQKEVGVVITRINKDTEPSSTEQLQIQPESDLREGGIPADEIPEWEYRLKQ